jgi:hypothetical protein
VWLRPLHSGYRTACHFHAREEHATDEQYKAVAAAINAS